MEAVQNRQFGGAAVSILPTAEEVARAVAERFVETANSAIAERGKFAVALAGGSTPKRAYEVLASPEFHDRVDWSSVYIFFGDERTVPPDDPQSNYRMAREAMLDALPIPADHIFRMKGEADPETAAREYEQRMRFFFPSSDWPRLDLVLLGMGEDGHTASLFPNTTALSERSRWVVNNRVDKLRTNRLTLTLPAINRAASVLFAATGAPKADVLKAVLNPASEADKLPASMIQPVNGRLEWSVDRQAAAELL
jgi:6-phosphogluconolactonase